MYRGLSLLYGPISANLSVASYLQDKSKIAETDVCDRSSDVFDGLNRHLEFFLADWLKPRHIMKLVIRINFLTKSSTLTP